MMMVRLKQHANDTNGFFRRGFRLVSLGPDNLHTTARCVRALVPVLGTKVTTHAVLQLYSLLVELMLLLRNPSACLAHAR